MRGDPALLERYAIDGKAPKVVLVVTVNAVFFQCARALVRSDLWNPDKHVERSQLPSVGEILAQASAARIDAAAYDRELPERIKTTLY